MNPHRPRRLLLAAIACLLSGTRHLHLLAAPNLTPAPPQSLDHTFTHALILDSPGRAGRNTTFTDALEAQLVAGSFSTPDAGTVLRLPDGSERTWRLLQANTNGNFEGRSLRGAHAFLAFEFNHPAIALLEASGHNMAYVNAEPHPGDPYRTGTVKIPVALRPGTNQILLMAARGSLRARLTEPPAPVFIDAADPTLPDALENQPSDTHAGIVVINATPHWQRSLLIHTRVGQGPETTTPLPHLPPQSTRKVPVRLAIPPSPASGPLTATLHLTGATTTTTPTPAPPSPARFDLRVRTARDARKITFRSTIDGSVQYYAIKPAPVPHAPGRGALFLTLHGASVEAIGQAEAYAPKSWGTLVAPTNRRPYGFDWEEWGRLDTLEVLQLATELLQPDPSQIYLTGHSMGGHGTWIVGATFPDRFAAIAPSAGWRSFWSYAGSDRPANPSPVDAILRRATAPSDTLGLSTNLLHHGVYVLHGDADDNVPVSEARAMREHLARFHHDLAWHEQTGAGHWWDDSDEPGAACVDWPPLFDFFARHRRPDADSTRTVDFTTMNPGVSARSRWATIHRQDRCLEPSRIRIQWDPGQRRFRGETWNVRLLSLETHDPHTTGQPFTVELDGQSLKVSPAPATNRLWLARHESRWNPATEPHPGDKGPHRAGPFKEAFQHQFLFVIGTHGTPDENAWALAKARFDAETFWVRGNGSVDIVTDTDFTPARFPDRSVVLYGHRSMNAAWDPLLASSPVLADRSRITVGSRTLERPDLGIVFLQPRRDSSRASVAVIAGTGPAGLRLTHRLPVFLSGTGFPDCLIVGPDIHSRGSRGVVAAGFFEADWKGTTDFAWQTE